MLTHLKKIEQRIIELDQHPQFGFSQSFPIEEIQAHFQELLNCPQISLVLQEKGWDSKAPWQEVGLHYYVVTLEIAPLEQPIFFVMHEQNLKELMAQFFNADKSLSAFYDREIVEGFYQYLSLEMLRVIADTDFMQPFTPRLAAVQWDHLPKEEIGYVCDLGCKWDGHTVWGHLFVPQPFRDQWKHHISAHPFGVHLSPELPLKITLEIGWSHLSPSSIQAIRVGDLVLLDRCEYQPTHKQGYATLWVHSEPIFRGQYQPEGLKLEELTFEARGERMDKEDDEDEEHPSEPIDQGVEIHELPVRLTVEAGQLTMTLKELSELSPGNLLPLSETPELGVTLWVNNKRLGKGELVQIGEGVGVRIISL